MNREAGLPRQRSFLHYPGKAQTSVPGLPRPNQLSALPPKPQNGTSPHADDAVRGGAESGQAGQALVGEETGRNEKANDMLNKKS